MRSCSGTSLTALPLFPQIASSDGPRGRGPSKAQPHRGDTGGGASRRGHRPLFDHGAMVSARRTGVRGKLDSRPPMFESLLRFRPALFVTVRRTLQLDHNELEGLGGPVLRQVRPKTRLGYSIICRSPWQILSSRGLSAAAAPSNALLCCRGPAQASRRRSLGKAPKAANRSREAQQSGMPTSRCDSSVSTALNAVICFVEANGGIESRREP